jgi:hypothetical protein
MHKSLVDTGKLVRALNAANGTGTFRSTALGLGDVRIIQHRRGWCWDDVADSDDIEELAALVGDYLPGTAPDGRIEPRLVTALFGRGEV